MAYTPPTIAERFESARRCVADLEQQLKGLPVDFGAQLTESILTLARIEQRAADAVGILQWLRDVGNIDT